MALDVLLGEGRFSDLAGAQDGDDRVVVKEPLETVNVAGSTLREAVRVSLGTAHDREMLQAGLEILADVLRGGPGGRAVEM